MTTETITPADLPRLLTPGEVAHMFRVDPKTVARWAKTGRLVYVRTMGGQRRYPSEQFRTAPGATS